MIFFYENETVNLEIKHVIGNLLNSCENTIKLVETIQNKDIFLIDSNETYKHKLSVKYME